MYLYTASNTPCSLRPDCCFCRILATLLCLLEPTCRVSLPCIQSFALRQEGHPVHIIDQTRRQKALMQGGRASAHYSPTQLPWLVVKSARQMRFKRACQVLHRLSNIGDRGLDCIRNSSECRVKQDNDLRVSAVQLANWA